MYNHLQCLLILAYASMHGLPEQEAAVQWIAAHAAEFREMADYCQRSH